MEFYSRREAACLLLMVDAAGLHKSAEDALLVAEELLDVALELKEFPTVLSLRKFTQFRTVFFSEAFGFSLFRLCERTSIWRLAP